ncbi:MAG: helix-turn-helix domain-containing protein [Anaerolinea sp.]|nr:helix-turn-helix domain-containing protein [Anaerolinea sp.]
MPEKMKVRVVSEEERQEVERLARSRTEPARMVQRAKLIASMLNDENLSAAKAGRQVGYKSDASGQEWVRRFNGEGLAGLKDEQRKGRPRTHSESVRSALISLALKKPDSLGLPFKLWTLERLQTEFRERHGVHLSGSTIWEWLAEEGLEWKRQESWFHDAKKHDPQFEEKRGA